ncbi:MAG: helix-hairpin-helix domain-containing protein [Bacteroidia bacterium]|nr:helix-hairpin-helix domain-containing protein [Bacteroidia bacterium]
MKKNMFRVFTDYFDFTRSEKKATVLVCIIIVVLTLMPFLWPYFIKPTPIDIVAAEKKYRELDGLPEYKPHKQYYQKEEYKSGSYKNDPVKPFSFDPNTISDVDLKRLGFKPWIAERIFKFRNSGGKFYDIAGFKKVYGVDSNLVNSLKNYMRFPVKPERESNIYKKEEFVKKQPTIIDLNTADSALIVTLPGIGQAFARRILKYRDLLGGFYKKEQLLEVYGLDNEKFESIESRIIISGNFKTININKATLAEMKHPYINYTQAKAIVNFRVQHGNYSDFKSLEQVKLLDALTLEKLKPYLSF